VVILCFSGVRDNLSTFCEEESWIILVTIHFEEIFHCLQNPFDHSYFGFYEIAITNRAD